MNSLVLKAIRLPALALVLMTLAFAGAVSAQSNSSGNITGEAVTGDTVVAINADTGLKREIEIKKDGKYRMRSLPLGTYVVSIKHADGTMGPSSTVTIRVGATVFIPAAKSEATPPSTP